MAEEKKDGWAVDDGPPLHGRFRDSGRGATTESSAPPLAEPASEAEAREGDPVPEFPPLGWGGPGENYPPAKGPNDRGS